MDYDKPRAKGFLLEEIRVKLHDSRIDLLGLTEPEEINFLNFSDGAFDSLKTYGNISVDIMLS